MLFPSQNSDGRLNYPLDTWVLLPEEKLKKGDLIAFYSKIKKREVKAEVIEFFYDRSVSDGALMKVRDIETDTIGIVDTYKTILYLLSKLEDRGKSMRCTCGAKHTSIPTYHMSYCDLSTKG